MDAIAAGVAVDLPPGLSAFIRRGDLPPSWRRHPSLAVGRAVEGLIVDLRSARGGVIVVSPRHLGLQRCEAALNKRRTVRAHVTGVNRGGLVAEVDGLGGFLPRPELRPKDALRYADLVGTTVRAYVIRVSRQQAILSAFPPRVRRRRGYGPDS